MIGTMTLEMLAAELGGELSGANVEFSSLSTDTRTLQPGEVYLALTGENFDGNEFVNQAYARQAAGAIVSRKCEVPLSQLVVKDTHEAHGNIASINRQRSKACVIALTGSQGKTTVKEMLGAILGLCSPTLVTEANLNNTIGVPKTLLRLTEEHQYAVIEMGANRSGEIAFSVAAAKPDVVMITNASPAHIEGFGSLQGIVEAKGEIIDGVKDGGVVALNADDSHIADWKRRAGSRRQVLFSLHSSEADYFASDVVVGANGETTFTLHTPTGEAEVGLQLLGRHNVMNAIAAAAASLESGATLNHVVKGLGSLAPVAGRLQPLSGRHGCCLLNDTYNASPGSFAAAIDVLMSFPGRRILVAGDMKELGDESEQSHRQVGDYAANAGVDELWAVGDQSKHTVEGFGPAGELFASQDDLVAACIAAANTETVFLVKGSRGAKMESVLTKLTESGEQ